MAVENWIDAIVDVWAGIDNGKGGKVRAFSVYRKDEFPNALAAEQMPCVLTYTTSVEADSNDALGFDHWRGVSEFHLFPNLDRANYPAVMLFYKRIRQAAAANIKLGNRVSLFVLRNNVSRVTGASIEGPVALQYGSESPHLGLVVHWLVKEDVTTETPVSIGS